MQRRKSAQSSQASTTKGKERTMLFNYGASQLFTPAALPDALIWMRSDTLVTTGTGRLTVWGDALGGPNTLVPQSTGPLYNASDSDYNGLPSFTHATGNGLTSTLNVPYGAYTIFIAGRLDAALPGYLYFHTDLGTYFDNCAGVATSGCGDTRAGVGCIFNMPALWANATTPKVYTIRFNGTQASKTVRINGTPVTLTNSASADPGPGICQGLLKFWGFGGRQSAGTTAELIVCTSALSDALTAQTERYMISRYGLV
jgi:hypothetical protein